MTFITSPALVLAFSFNPIQPNSNQDTHNLRNNRAGYAHLFASFIFNKGNCQRE